jgi:hypothetical protein
MEPVLTFFEVADVARVAGCCRQTVRIAIRSGALVPVARTARGVSLFNDLSVSTWIQRRAERKKNKL